MPLKMTLDGSYVEKSIVNHDVLDHMLGSDSAAVKFFSDDAMKASR
jgi:hypothetical protein